MRTMRRFLGLSVGVAALMVLGMSGFAFAHEGHEGKNKGIDKKDVPAVVLSAFEKAYPNAKIKEIEKKDENGTVSYGIEAKEGKVKLEAVYAVDGSVVEIKEVIKPDSLPEVIKNAVAAQYPNGKITEAEKVIKGTAAEYEIDVIVGKEETELTVNESGAILSTNKDTGDKEEGEQGEKGEKDDDDKDKNAE
jgi:hypothetical protein